MVVGPDDQTMKVVTPCPESPGQWPEYPGVTVKIFRCYDSKKKDVIVVVSPVPESGARTIILFTKLRKLKKIIFLKF